LSQTLKRATIFSLLTLLPNLSIANDTIFEVTSETIFRVFERELQDGENCKIIPVYEYISVDYGDIEKIEFQEESGCTYFEWS
jgi:hypothetical protein